VQDLNVNLDCEWPDDLEEQARVFETLAAYAKLKASAMRDRAAGNIPDALAQERQCDIYYKTLPPWARW
jgi:hypothetical protein